MKLMFLGHPGINFKSRCAALLQINSVASHPPPDVTQPVIHLCTCISVQQPVIPSLSITVGEEEEEVEKEIPRRIKDRESSLDGAFLGRIRTSNWN